MRMAKSDATDAEIEALCQRTGYMGNPAAESPSDQPGFEYRRGANLVRRTKEALALTRCLLRDPAILLLVEPTVGMDNQEKFGEILAKLQEATTGKAVIVVDHDVNWLLQFCSYFVLG